MTVHAYARVSTDRQAETGHSIETQRRMLEGYAQMHDLRIRTWHIDRGVSGSVPLAERPEGRKLLEAVRPKDVILTSKLDRMFRSANDALRVLDTLKAQHIALHMLDLGGDVTGNGVSKLVFTILSAVAEAERDRIRERLRDTHAKLRAEGRFAGGRPPFGWDVDDDGFLTPNQGQQNALTVMTAMRRNGESLRKIQAAIREMGHDLSLMGVKRIVDARVTPPEVRQALQGKVNRLADQIAEE